MQKQGQRIGRRRMSDVYMPWMIIPHNHKPLRPALWKAGSVRPPSNVWEMTATLTNEQQADAARREHITKEARKDWDRDFGHTFPDLMAGPTPAEALKYPLLAGRLT